MLRDMVGIWDGYAAHKQKDCVSGDVLRVGAARTRSTPDTHGDDGEKEGGGRRRVWHFCMPLGRWSDRHNDTYLAISTCGVDEDGVSGVHTSTPAAATENPYPGYLVIMARRSSPPRPCTRLCSEHRALMHMNARDTPSTRPPIQRNYGRPASPQRLAGTMLLAPARAERASGRNRGRDGIGAGTS